MLWSCPHLGGSPALPLVLGRSFDLTVRWNPWISDEMVIIPPLQVLGN